MSNRMERAATSADSAGGGISSLAYIDWYAKLTAATYHAKQ